MLRTLSRSRSVRALVAAGCLAVAWPAAAYAALSPTLSPTPTPTPAAACASSRDELTAMNADRAWSLAGGKGAGTTIAVIGTVAKAAEAECSVRALAPEAAVHLYPVADPGGALTASAVQTAAGPGTVVMVFADTSVDLADPELAAPLANAEAQGIVVVAAAGDGFAVMPGRPAEIINVSAFDLATHRLRDGSASGPRVTLAGYGNDTATAAGYVAAAAALVRTLPGRGTWPVRQVAAQLAGTINPISGSPHDDQLGYGVLSPVPALSSGPVDPASLPGFAALFPVPPTPGTSVGTPSSQLVGVPGTGPSGASGSQGAAPAEKSSSGGVSPLVIVGFGALAGAGALVFWRRRRVLAAPPPKGPDEWEPPTGNRHSGYSSPPE